MRNTVIGLALALLFLAGLFALPQFSGHEDLKTLPVQVAAKVEPGFKGVRRIGPWILACAPARPRTVPLPFSLGPAQRAAPSAGAPTFGRCRTFVAFHRRADPKQVVLLLNFRLLGRAQGLVMLVRIPPAAKKGDMVTLRLGPKTLNLPVSACEKGSCLALTAIAPGQEAGLYSAELSELILPPGPDGNRLAVRIPLKGLRPAIAAMRRAQVGD